MQRNVVLVIAVALYGLVLGCALMRSDAADHAPPRSAPTSFRADLAEGLPYRAVVLQIQRVDYIDKYKRCIDEIADLGADSVKFVLDARQENGSSSRIFLDMRMTPTPQQLGELIQHAKSRKLRVIVMPIVLLDAPRGTEWRGRIAPESWDKWWQSYREMMHHFSWICEANGVDVMVVGSELVSTEAQVDQWTRTIEQVRKEFSGKLTYSANWDHYNTIKFWDQLDFIGMNSYWSLGKNKDASLEEIKKNWAKIQGELFEFQKKVKKPIFFLEVGWCSMSNMAHEPWDYTKDDREAPTDNELQRRLYEGFFESWHGRPELGGFGIWQWTPDPDPKDTEGQEQKLRGYTPKDKPAEKVLREWMGKKWE
jgi:hypothetical protein